MWERFSFYGMQALLAFYIYYSVTDGGLGMSQTAATSIVGAYGGLVYLSAVLGGWVADRVLGAERTLLTAAFLIMGGHLALAFIPGMLGLAIGLVGVALGSGSLKTTTSTVLGDLYDKGDQRRDAAFSIYYMGVNIGGFAGPLLTSALWGWKNFHWGFGLAAIGMAVGLTQYLLLTQAHRERVEQEAGQPALDSAEAHLGSHLHCRDRGRRIRSLPRLHHCGEPVDGRRRAHRDHRRCAVHRDPHEPPGLEDRAPPGVLLHSAVPRLGRVLVAVAAAVHGARDLR